MVISDTVARLPNPIVNEAIDLDIRVDDIELDLINFSPAKQEQLRTETRKCAVMNALSEVIYTKDGQKTSNNCPLPFNPSSLTGTPSG